MSHVHPTLEITYRLIRTERKSISLIVNPEEGLIVRAPKEFSIKLINDLILKKNFWIRSKLDHYASINQTIDILQSVEFPLLGRMIQVHRENRYGKRIEVSISSKIVIRYGNHTHNQVQQAIIRAYRRFSDQYMRNKVDQILVQLSNHGLLRNPEDIKTWQFKRRWGSMSKSGLLKLNWRLIFASPPIICYVIIHELVHLYHFNHSREYWKLVEQLDPEYKEHRNWLKLYGHTLRPEYKQPF